MTLFVILSTLTLDEFLAVGSWYPNNKKAELYNFGTGAWKMIDDYPFGSESERLSDYEMLYIPETRSYLVIGGDDGYYLSQIAKLKNGAWSDAGRLNSARYVSFCWFFYFF